MGYKPSNSMLWSQEFRNAFRRVGAGVVHGQEGDLAHPALIDLMIEGRLRAEGNDE